GRWSRTGGFQFLGSADASHVDIAANGDVVAAFGSGTTGSLWRITDRFGWQRLGTAAPAAVGIGGEWVAAAFGFPSGGLWRISDRPGVPKRRGPQPPPRPPKPPQRRGTATGDAR